MKWLSWSLGFYRHKVWFGEVARMDTPATPHDYEVCEMKNGKFFVTACNFSGKEVRLPYKVHERADKAREWAEGIERRRQEAAQEMDDEAKKWLMRKKLNAAGRKRLKNWLMRPKNI